MDKPACFILIPLVRHELPDIEHIGNMASGSSPTKTADLFSVKGMVALVCYFSAFDMLYLIPYKAHMHLIYSISLSPGQHALWRRQIPICGSTAGCMSQPPQHVQHSHLRYIFGNKPQSNMLICHTQNTRSPAAAQVRHIPPSPSLRIR